MVIIRIMALLTAVGMGIPEHETKIEGNWMNPAATAIMEIQKEGGRYYGELIWTEIEEKKDLVHSRVIKNLKPSGDKTYKDGEAYIPRLDMYLDCKALLNTDKLHLTVSKGFIEITKTWTKYGH